MTATVPMDADGINFGPVPEDIDNLLQRGVVAYRQDRVAADALFTQALRMSPSCLPVYYCLYKIHAYQGNLDQALTMARQGLAESARQAGWDEDWRNWTPQDFSAKEAARFSLYSLKAMAFIHLRRAEPQAAAEILSKLESLDPAGLVGWPVIADLALGLRPRQQAVVVDHTTNG